MDIKILQSHCATSSLSQVHSVYCFGPRPHIYYKNARDDDGRSISRNVISLNILVHGVVNLLYYEHSTDKRKYFYVLKI